MKRSIAIVTLALVFDVGSSAVPIRIGDEVIEGTWLNGKIVATNYVARSNVLYALPLTIVPIKAENVPKELAENEWGAALQLMFAMGDKPVKPGGVHALHGLAYMAGPLNFAEISSTNRVDMYATTDNTRIALMVWPNGPVYYTTNSGALWRVYSDSGTFNFPLTSGPDGDGGFYATTTIHASVTPRKNANSPPKTNSPPRTYVVAADPDGRRVAFELNVRVPAPALTITPIPEGVIVSWPAEDKPFVLQHKSELFKGDWTDLTNAVTMVGSENRVFIAPPKTNDFFRLRSGAP